MCVLGAGADEPSPPELKVALCGLGWPCALGQCGHTLCHICSRTPAHTRWSRDHDFPTDEISWRGPAVRPGARHRVLRQAVRAPNPALDAGRTHAHAGLGWGLSVSVQRRSRGSMLPAALHCQPTSFSDCPLPPHSPTFDSRQTVFRDSVNCRHFTRSAAGTLAVVPNDFSDVSEYFFSKVRGKFPQESG